MSNFQLKDITNHYSANLSKDLGLDAWDINQLIFLVEKQFDVKFENGVENQVTSLNQIALLTYKTINSPQNRMKVA